MVEMLNIVRGPKPIDDDDIIPDIDGIEYPCEVCGKESGPYSGRGRKPKKCPEHKTRTSVTTSSKVKGTNAALAAQATEALLQVNNIGAIIAMVIGFPETAGAIHDRETIFREQCYSALLTDPEMCRYLLRGGTTSGKFALAIAYIMFIASLYPVAINEYRDNRIKRTEIEQE